MLHEKKSAQDAIKQIYKKFFPSAYAHYNVYNDWKMVPGKRHQKCKLQTNTVEHWRNDYQIKLKKSGIARTPVKGRKLNPVGTRALAAKARFEEVDNWIANNIKPVQGEEGTYVCLRTLRRAFPHRSKGL